MLKFIFLSLIIPVSTNLPGQDSTKGPLAFNGYLEAFYLYDFNKPPMVTGLVLSTAITGTMSLT